METDNHLLDAIVEAYLKLHLITFEEEKSRLNKELVAFAEKQIKRTHDIQSVLKKYTPKKPIRDFLEEAISFIEEQSYLAVDDIIARQEVTTETRNERDSTCMGDY